MRPLERWIVPVMEPAAPLASSAQHTQDTPALHGVVLYIEDVQVNFELVEAMLRAHRGLRLIHATTGHEGVRLARSDRPDVILLDMHLPDIFGLEVVRLLNEDIAKGDFRVILLTADSLNIDVLKAMSLGAFEYLVKPVELRALEASMSRALSFKASGGSSASL
jgi:two-component system cell cycle response regulator DivK